MASEGMLAAVDQQGPGTGSALTIRQVAADLQVSRKIVYQLIESGQLDAFRPGRRHYRVLKEALQDYKNRCRSAGNTIASVGARG